MSRPSRKLGWSALVLCTSLGWAACSSPGAGPGMTGPGGDGSSGGGDSGPGGDDGSLGGGDDAGGMPDCTNCAGQKLPLRSGWQMQSSASVSDAGEQIATAGYAASGWLPVTVPTTVLGGLVQNGKLQDPYFSDNFDQLDHAEYTKPWWFRTEATLPAEWQGGRVQLHLDGVNYRANVFVNGHEVAKDGTESGAQLERDVVGTFRVFELDITSYLAAGANAIAVEVSPPDLADPDLAGASAADLTMTWVDWNPVPADHGLGLWNEVYLTHSGAVTVRAPQVATTLDAGNTTAHLSVRAQVANGESSPVTATITGTLDGALVFTQDQTLAAGAAQTLAFDESSFPALRVANPTLWWPRDLGDPTRHTLVVTATVDGVVSDTATVRFGMRQVTAKTNASGGVLYSINGKPLYLRAGAWTPDLLLRESWDATKAHFQYVNDLGLNAIRLEGKLIWDAWFDLADENGILVIPGWNCCDRWQAWGQWSAADHTIANASLRDQSLRLGNHPSVITFLLGSDQAPSSTVMSEYKSTLTAAHWPLLTNDSAANDGYKMNGPYDWVAPSYWETDTALGGAFGFASEVSPGPAIPTMETLARNLSAADLESLWKQPNKVQYHAGGGDQEGSSPFTTLGRFNTALSTRMGAPKSLEDWVKKAQVMNYEAERAMFEAYGRNKYTKSTGVVQWMLNNSWPSLIWHLFDYDLDVGGAYYGAKKANELVHIAYSYDDKSIVVINYGQAALDGLTAAVEVYNLDGSSKLSTTAQVSVAADGVAKATTFQPPAGVSATYFLLLHLTDASGKLVSENAYWMSTKAEAIDPGDSDWYYTGTKTFADFTALGTLGASTVKVDRQPTADGASITLTNTGSTVAFFVRLQLTQNGQPLLPALFSDNYVTLAPGKSRTLTVKYPAGASSPSLVVSGWNVAAQTL